MLIAPAYRLVLDLLAAKRDLSPPRQLRRLDNCDLPLLDALGYLPRGAEESEVLFTLIAERYERRSLGITSNLVFSQWEHIFERLRDEYGYDGGYTTVKDYVRENRRQTGELFVPLSHPPGHAQCDFGEARVVIGGVERKAHCFVIDLPHSNGCFVKAYPAETQDDCKVVEGSLYRQGSEIWECADMEAAESLFGCLELVPDPRRARGVRHPFQAILRLTLLGLVCGQTTMAHIALFAKMHWPVLREPLGFVRDHPPHATTISRTLAGVPYEQLQGALAGWVAQVVADQEVHASVDGKWAKQSEDVSGNPLVMVNVLAHDLKLCLAQWPASEKRYEPGVLREQLGQLFERYPGLRLLTMDALYAERDLCQAIVSHGRDYLVRIKGNQPQVLAALAEGFAGEGPVEPEAQSVEKKRA